MRLIPSVDGAAGVYRSDRWQLQLYGIEGKPIKKPSAVSRTRKPKGKFLESIHQIAEREEGPETGRQWSTTVGCRICAGIRREIGVGCYSLNSTSPQFNCLLRGFTLGSTARLEPTRRDQTRGQTKSTAERWNPRVDLANVRRRWDCLVRPRCRIVVEVAEECSKGGRAESGELERCKQC